MKREHVLQAYIVSVGSVSAAVLIWCSYLASHMAPSRLLYWVPVAVLFAVLGVLGSQREMLITASSTHHMGTVAQVAALLVLPYPLAICAIGVSKAVTELIIHFTRRRSLRALVVNIGASILANAAGGIAFHLLPGSQYLWIGDLRAVAALPALAALGGLYLVTETSVVAAAIALSSKEDAWSSLRRVVGGVFLPEASLILVGIIFGVLCHFSPVLSLLVIVPVLFSMRAFESVQQLREGTVEAVLKMAEAIDVRDTGTSDHSKRLAELTWRLARALELTPESVEEIVLASKVHDLGKIGISNEILLKDGPLTPEQRNVMQQHPVIGADILSEYEAFGDTVEKIVRHHHERVDGTGYPKGLKGEDIPIGSRIIAVVDAYDAMTAERPYRKGMSKEIAVQRLLDGIGSQFDGRVCGTFIDMLIKDGDYVRGEAVPALRLLPTKMSNAS